MYLWNPPWIVSNRSHKGRDHTRRQGQLHGWATVHRLQYTTSSTPMLPAAVELTPGAMWSQQNLDPFFVCHSIWWPVGFPEYKIQRGSSTYKQDEFQKAVKSISLKVQNYEWDLGFWGPHFLWAGIFLALKKKSVLFCLQWTFTEAGNPSLPQSPPTEGREPLAAKESTLEFHLQIRNGHDPTVPSVVFDKFPQNHFHSSYPAFKFLNFNFNLN